MFKKFIAFLILVLVTLVPNSQAIGNQSSGPIIFVIDTSGSMKIEKIDAVRKSVRAIIGSLQMDQEIGIISFSKEVNTLLPITTNHEEALRSIDSLFAGGDTSMYDAVLLGLKGDSITRPSQLILLSDGEDTTSVTQFDFLLTTLSSTGIPVNAIGVQVSKNQQEILNKLSVASGGQYFNISDINDLLATFRTILEPQFDPSPIQTPIDQGKINTSGSVRSGNLEFEIGISLFVALLTFILFLNIRNRLQKRERQIARLSTLQKYSYRSFKRAAGKFRSTITSYSFIPDRFENWIKLKLELIHSDIAYETVIKLLLASWSFLSLSFLVVSKNLFIAVSLSTFAVPSIFIVVIGNIRQKQIVRFSEELPELLNILASALRAGLSLPQGLEAYSTDSKGEVARQIRRTIGEIRVGTPIDESLMGVADRMESDDLRWAVTALSIQRVVGGSMATILTTTFETVKARSEIRREVKTLSAEGKLSAYVLMSLPVGIFSFLLLTRREYVSVFWSEPGGIFLLGVVFIALTIGWTWMKKIVDIKI